MAEIDLRGEVDGEPVKAKRDLWGEMCNFGRGSATIRARFGFYRAAATAMA